MLTRDRYRDSVSTPLVKAAQNGRDEVHDLLDRVVELITCHTLADRAAPDDPTSPLGGRAPRGEPTR